MAYRPYRRTAKAVGGFRSGLERDIARDLTDRGVPFEYEKLKLKFEVVRDQTYTPDFVLPNGIIIEAKGYFTSADRTKHQRVQAAFPDHDIRFVFQRASTRLNKTSSTTYGQWATKHGFKWADGGKVPASWLKEKKK